jgi:hypothetical protein
MTHRHTGAAALAASVCFALFSSGVAAQAAKGITGAWTLVSNVVTDASGKKEPLFGDKPMGQATFTPNGRYSIIITRGDLPKIAANTRTKGTADENKAVVTGSLAHYGKYTVNAKDKVIVLHVESSTYPNWNGTEQKRPYTLSGKELKWTTANASGGGTAELAWKKVD